MVTIPSIFWKQNVITDLKFKSYLLVDYSNCSSEKIAIENISTNFDKFKKQARKKHFSQIQIKFPHLWTTFLKTIKNFRFNEGLFFVKKRISKNSANLADKIRIINEISTIKKSLITQQKLHYDLAPDFFDSIKAFNFDDYLNEIKKSIDNGSGVIFGTFEGEKLTGFIGLEKSKPGYYISELFIDSKYRGIGMGTKLFNAGMDYVKKGKTKIIWTTLSAKNLKALHFYEKLGFKVTETLSYLNLQIALLD